MAKLYFKYGAMNCGKTTILLQTAHNYEERGMKIIIIKPSKDLKAGDNIQSRLGAERKVDYLIKPEDSVLEIAKKNLDVNCIFVDEVQFLDPNQIDELLQITIVYDIPVICYGLRTDFKTNGFPASTRLLEIAHKIEEIKTMCRCGDKAIFNARFIDGKLTNKGNQVAIDGFNNITYESMCPKCYYEALNNSKIKKLTK